MILRAVDLAEGRPVEPLRWLAQLRDWTNTGLPPVHGGLNDQPAMLLYQGRYLRSVFDIWRAWRTNKDYRPTGAEAKLFQSVLKLIEQRRANQRARIE
jgi:hypothetical protein